MDSPYFCGLKGKSTDFSKLLHNLMIKIYIKVIQSDLILKCSGLEKIQSELFTVMVIGTRRHRKLLHYICAHTLPKDCDIVLLKS